MTAPGDPWACAVITATSTADPARRALLQEATPEGVEALADMATGFFAALAAEYDIALPELVEMLGMDIATGAL